MRRRAVFVGILLSTGIVYSSIWRFPRTSLGSSRLALFGTRLLMPVGCFFAGLCVVANASRPAFLLGQAYPHGVWFYFPVLFALTSAPGFLGAIRTRTRTRRCPKFARSPKITASRRSGSRTTGSRIL